MTDQIEALRIEPVAARHNRKAFTCKKPPLAEYLRRYARQNDQNNIAKTFVAVDDKQTVHGYYSLSSTGIEFETLTEEYSRGLPQYPIPAALIGKLAVDKKIEGQRLGSRLLIDALQRVLTVSADVAVKVVIVDTIDDKAKAYYLHFGFIELPGHELKLFLPIETIVQLF